MAAVGQLVTVGTSATLVFQVVDGITYSGLASPAANIFKSGDVNAPLPITFQLPASGTIYFGGIGVTASGGTVGAAIVCSSQMISYNCVGGDSLYAIVASSTAAIQLLTLRQ